MALTPNLNLHIYDKDSKPTYLVDHNNDMTAIDQGYAALKLSTDTASANVSGLTTQVNTVQQLAESASALATQANENSSHASADASAAVAAANNANTEAAKAVAATEGLVNIDDLSLSPGEGWNLIHGKAEVVNGCLLGQLTYNHGAPSSLSLGSVTWSSNYNIPVNTVLGSAHSSKTTDTTATEPTTAGNLTMGATWAQQFTIIIATLSCKWDAAWTKKTGS